jgi:hypothetical protein
MPAVCKQKSSDSEKYIQLHGVIYDDDTVAKMITVITATSPTVSMPNTTHLYPAQVSLHKIGALAKAKKIIVFDGIPPHDQHLIHAYNAYKQSVVKLTQSDYYFKNTELVFCPDWGHLSGTIEVALKHVKTPYVFMHQHDLIIKKDFDLNAVLATMIKNPEVKYVHFWGGKNKKSKWWNGPVDDEVEVEAFVELTRSFGWSDQCHLASVNYYNREVLPECDHCFMETAMQKRFKKELAIYGKDAHEDFGTYLYGGLSDGGYIQHTDGRNKL